VVSSECSYSILSTKVEVKLLKSTASKKWADLEGKPRESPAEKSEPEKKAPPKAEKPLYPSSSKTGPKDWDRLANELTAKPKKTKPEDGVGDNLEYDSDYDGGDPVNHFFKKLYKDADEDTRRAMMKSYIESNGTALSTNWEEVGKGKVETSPPGRLLLLQECDGTPLIGKQRE
jgi:suppressor of G2 allele of SKP1